MKTWVKVVVALLLLVFGLVWRASNQGWGLQSDDEEEARQRSVRSGSLHSRSYSNWGTFSGK